MTTAAGATLADALGSPGRLTPAKAVAIAATLAAPARNRWDLDIGAERATAATFQNVIKVGEI